MSEIFDRNELMERVDGDIEFLQETIAMLDEDCPTLFAQIRAAAASGDAEQLAAAAHALKGMLANFCAEPAEAAARELEMMGRNGQLTGVEVATEQMQLELDRLQKALHEFLRSVTE